MASQSYVTERAELHQAWNSAPAASAAREATIRRDRVAWAEQRRLNLPVDIPTEPNPPSLLAKTVKPSLSERTQPPITDQASQDPRELPPLEGPSLVSTNQTEEASPRRITLRSLRAAAEIHAISRALEETGWNRRRAAEMLSISYRGLLYKIRQHNITPPKDPGLAGLCSSER